MPAPLVAALDGVRVQGGDALAGDLAHAQVRAAGHPDGERRREPWRRRRPDASGRCAVRVPSRPSARRRGVLAGDGQAQGGEVFLHVPGGHAAVEMDVDDHRPGGVGLDAGAVADCGRAGSGARGGGPWRPPWRAGRGAIGRARGVRGRGWAAGRQSSSAARADRQAEHGNQAQDQQRRHAVEAGGKHVHDWRMRTVARKQDGGQSPARASRRREDVKGQQRWTEVAAWSGKPPGFARAVRTGLLP